MTHATGLAVGVTTPLILGSGIHLLDVWEPGEGLRRIAKFKTTVSMAATPFLQMALGAIEAGADHDVSSMRLWVSAGAPIPETLLQEWKKALPDCTLLPVYGSSEGLLVTAVRVDDPVEKVLSSDGRAFDGVALEIRDEEGAVVPAGEEGQIFYGDRASSSDTGVTSNARPHRSTTVGSSHRVTSAASTKPAISGSRDGSRT